MENSINCISPIDGRYNRYTDSLRKYFSEYALFKYRVQFEIEYFIYLKTLKLPELSINYDVNNLRKIYQKFEEKDCIKIKNIEKKINHDVKAVEYFLHEKFHDIGLSEYIQFIHFGLTSQDINNNSVTLSLKECIENEIIPLIEEILSNLIEKCNEWVDFKMISHTHGQPAVPTTMGKEIQVFHYRITKQLQELKTMKYYGKLGGAIGNLNAHYAAYPNYNWEKNMEQFLSLFSLKREKLTTQIDNYENISGIFDCIKRINTILLDMNKDIWHYISIDYISQKFNKNEVGSSTMPHKINPINFENSEGNLSIANCLLNFMSEKLPVSRLQRDLTDSTVLRNIGTIFGHMLIAYKNLNIGLQKLDINHIILKQDLHNNTVVIVEGLQTILRKHGYQNAYELFKDLTRTNEKIDIDDIRIFIQNLEISENIKSELHSITAENYIGNSSKININY